MRFEQAARRYVRWCADAMLPLWARQGVDRRHGGFFEQLHSDGTADTRAARRVRVTSRQIYAFAHASLMGWTDARSLVAWGVDYLLGGVMGRDGEPGMAHLLDAGGDIIDGRRDLYDHAFHIMALSWAGRACDDAQMLHQAEALLAFVDEAMAAPGGGWQEGAPAALPRRQNPHMHMLEAMLSLYEASKNDDYLRRADALIALMQERFVEAESGLLLEDFNADLSPVRPARIEPGHMAEWCWLLHWRARPEDTNALAIAARFGAYADTIAQSRDGFLPDALSVQGTPLGNGRRLWCQSEWLKSMLVRAGGKDGRTGAAALLSRLQTSYLDAPTPGLWIDRFDLDGQPCDGPVPASIVYHLVSTAAELARALPESKDATP